MQFVVMDGFHPQNAAAALYMDGHFLGDGMYRLGPWTLPSAYQEDLVYGTRNFPYANVMIGFASHFQKKNDRLCFYWLDFKNA